MNSENKIQPTTVGTGLLKGLMPPWSVILVKAVVIPVLRNVGAIFETEAKKTTEQWDDVAAGAFKTVIEVLEQELS